MVFDGGHCKMFGAFSSLEKLSPLLSHSKEAEAGTLELPGAQEG